MTTDDNRIEKILRENQGYIGSIRDGIVECVHEGIRQGIGSGTKRAFRDVLKKECQAQGIMNIGGVDIETIVDDDTLMIIRPLSPREADTMYELTMSEDARSRGREYLEENYGFTFATY